MIFCKCGCRLKSIRNRGSSPERKLIHLEIKDTEEMTQHKTCDAHKCAEPRIVQEGYAWAYGTR